MRMRLGRQGRGNLGAIGGAATGGGMGGAAVGGARGAGNYNANWNPAGEGGGSLGDWDVIGNAIDSKNPWSGQGMGGGPGGPGGTDAGFQNLLNQGSGFQSSLDEAGKLKDIYSSKLPGNVTAGQMKFGNDQKVMNQTAFFDPYKGGATYDALQKRATETGPSAWANMQTEKQGVEQQAAADQASQLAGTQEAQVRSALAMKGGLSSGAGERAAKDAARTRNLSMAGVARQGQMDRLGIGIADEATKTGLLGQAAGMETGIGEHNLDQKLATQQFNIGNKLDTQKFNVANDLASQQFNIGNKLGADKYNAGNELQNNQFNTSNALAGLGGQNANNLQQWQSKMAGQAANLSGDAISKGGKK